MKPTFSKEFCQELLEKVFSLKIFDLKPLPSYDDQNYQFHDSKLKKWILKIFNTETSHDLLNFQISYMIELEKQYLNTEITIFFPSLLSFKDENNRVIFIYQIPETQFLCIVVSFIEGITLEKGVLKLNSENEKSSVLDLFEKIGFYLGLMDKKMEHFQHSKMKRENFEWDLRNSHIIEPNIKYVKERLSNDIYEFISIIFKQHNEKFKDFLNLKSKCGVVHGDANEQNIIVSENGKEFRAFIDFGDLSFAPYIANVSISLAYLILLVEKEKINICIKKFLKGYEMNFKIAEQEKKMIPNLIKLRLATSLCNSSAKVFNLPKDHSDREYILISEKPIIQVLTWLLKNELIFEI